MKRILNDLAVLFKFVLKLYPFVMLGLFASQYVGEWEYATAGQKIGCTIVGLYSFLYLMYGKGDD